jgi:hypothetical protein
MTHQERPEENSQKTIVTPEPGSEGSLMRSERLQITTKLGCVARARRCPSPEAKLPLSEVYPSRWKTRLSNYSLCAKCKL